MNVDEVLKYEGVKQLKNSLKTKPSENFETDQRVKKQKSVFENHLNNLNNNEKLQFIC